jgi:hypothetical protein
MIIFGCLFIIILIGIILFDIYEGKVYLTNLFNSRKQLPEKYNGYSYLGDITEFGNYKIQHKFRSKGLYGSALFTDIEENVTINNHLIIKTTEQIDDDHLIYNYYKLDSDGTIIDTTSFDYELLIAKNTGNQIMFGDFLINIGLDYYSTWIADGNKSRIPFKVINQDLSWGKEEVENYYRFVVENSRYLAESQYFENYESKVKKIFYLKDEWYVWYGFNRSKKDFNVRLNWQKNSLFHKHDEDSMDWQIRKVDNLTVELFDRVRYRAFVHSIGGGSQSSKNYGWEGVVYFVLHLKKGKLLFKENNVMEKSQGKYPDLVFFKEKYGFYQNPKLNFTLLLIGTKNLFVIKSI